MPATPFIDRVPLWLVLLATVAIVVVPVELGYRLGRFSHRRPNHELEKAVDVFVAPALGLLALILAFTFSLAQARFESRQQAQMESTNAIATAFLRAALAPPAYRDEIRRLLRAEVDTRLLRNGRGLPLLAQLNDTLWRVTVEASGHIPQSDIAALVVQSVNEVFSTTHRRMVTVLSSRVPLPIWVALALLSVSGMALMGYASGFTGSPRSPAMIPITTGFCIVTFLIVDLDRPFTGLVTLDYASLTALRDAFAQQKIPP